MKDIKNNIKEEVRYYILYNNNLWNLKLKISIILKKKELKIIIKVIYKNLNYYDKNIILNIMKKRYEIILNIWEKKKKILNLYIFYQLYKSDLKSLEIMIIHFYNIKKFFNFWEIDFINYLIKISYENKYFIIVIDYNISKIIIYILKI